MFGKVFEGLPFRIRVAVGMTVRRLDE